jgi:hypothetical protein
VVAFRPVEARRGPYNRRLEEQTMAPKTTANSFKLNGRGITATYATTSIDGTPRFTFKKGKQTLNFAGDEIDAVEAGIGSLVSVTIASVPDKSVTTFSVLIPTIRLTGSKKQAFRTIGVTTVAKTTIAGPPPGVEQTYKVTAMRGTAQIVVS